MENKYEFKEKQIEVLRGQVEKLREAVKKEDKEIRDLITEKIQSLTPNKLWLGIEILRKYSDYWRVQVEFVNEEGKNDFGSSFTMYVYVNSRSSYHKDGIYLNCGTIGEWNVDENPYQYSRLILMNLICEHRASLYMFFKGLEDKIVIAPAFEKMRDELDALEYELKADIRKDKELAIEAKLIPGAEIQLGENFFAKVTKITPKRIYFARGQHKYNWITHKHEKEISYSSYRDEFKNKYDLIDTLYYAQERNDENIKILN